MSFKCKKNTILAILASTSLYPFAASAAIGPYASTNDTTIYDATPRIYTTGGFFGTAQPVFNGEVTFQGNIDILVNAVPVFNNTFNAGPNTIFSIYGNATPVFNASLNSDHLITCYGDSVPVFNGTVSTNVILIVSQNTNPTFGEDVNVTDMLDIYGQSKSVFAKNVTANYVQVYGTAETDFQGNVTSNLGIEIAGSPTITFGDTPTTSNSKIIVRNEYWINKITNNIGVVDTNTVFKGTINFNEINIQKNATKNLNLNFADGIKLYTPVTTSSNKTGNITFTGGGLIGANIGVDGTELKLIQFSLPNDKTLTVSDNVSAYSEQLELAGNGIYAFNNSHLAVSSGAIGIDNSPTVSFEENFSSTAAFSLKNSAAPTFKGNITAPIVINSSLQRLKLDEVTVSAPITSATHRQSNIDFLGSVIVGSNIGTNDKWINHLQFSVADSKNFELKTGINMYGYQINIDGSATYKMDGNITGEAIGIAESAKPTFNGALTANSVAVSANSEPIFNSGTINSTNFTISDTSSPTFNGVQVTAPNGINVEDSPTITLNEGFTLDTKFNIKDNAAPTFEGTLVPPVELSNNNQTLNFGENIAIKDKIETTVHKAANVSFKGTANVESQIGSENLWLGKVEFISDADRKDVKLGGDIYSDKLKFKNVSVILTEDVKIQSGQNSLEIIDGVVDLKSKKLTLAGNNVITGDVTFKTVFDSDAGVGGNIVVDGAASRLDFSAANPVSVEIYGNTPLPEPNSVYEYKLIKTTNDGTVVPNPNITFTSSEANNLLKWTYDPATYELKGVYDPEILPQIINEAGGNDNDLAVAGFLANNTEANKILSNIGLLSGPAAQLNAIKGLQPVDQTSEQISANLDRNLNNVDNRITNLVTPSLFGDLSGIGSGDAQTRYGVWISPFVGSSLRKKNGSSPKSSTKFYGASIGIDTAINDDLMLGAAITPMHTDSKFSGAKTGSKGEINSLLLSLYGYRQLGNNWYLSGVFCGGQNKVKQQEHRILTSSITEIARSSYDVKSFSTQFSIGYNYKLSDSLIVTPVGGLGYYWIDSASYTETGTTLTNLKAKRGSAYIAEAVFGLQMAYAGKIKDTNVTPEVHAYVSYDFKRKESAIHATLQNFTTALPLSAHKYSKVYYNIGTEINAESPSKKFEYGVSYEAELTKYSSTHTGAIKVKVLF